MMSCDPFYDPCDLVRQEVETFKGREKKHLTCLCVGDRRKTLSIDNNKSRNNESHSVWMNPRAPGSHGCINMICKSSANIRRTFL